MRHLYYIHPLTKSPFLSSLFFMLLQNNICVALYLYRHSLRPFLISLFLDWRSLWCMAPHGRLDIILLSPSDRWIHHGDYGSEWWAGPIVGEPANGVVTFFVATETTRAYRHEGDEMVLLFVIGRMSAGLRGLVNCMLISLVRLVSPLPPSLVYSNFNGGTYGS